VQLKTKAVVSRFFPVALTAFRVLIFNDVSVIKHIFVQLSYIDAPFQFLVKIGKITILTKNYIISATRNPASLIGSLLPSFQIRFVYLN